MAEEEAAGSGWTGESVAVLHPRKVPIVIVTDDEAVMDMTVKVDPEDDRGPILLATTMIAIDAAATTVGEEDTAVVASVMVIGMAVKAGDSHMEDHRIEELRHRTPEPAE